MQWCVRMLGFVVIVAQVLAKARGRKATLRDPGSAPEHPDEWRGRSAVVTPHRALGDGAEHPLKDSFVQRVDAIPI